MSVFVEVLKRNYLSEKITLEKLDTLLLEGKLTQSEYDYIIN
jgi:hypothetical protein